MIFALCFFAFLSGFGIAYFLLQFRSGVQIDRYNIEPIVSLLKKMNPSQFLNYIRKKIVTARWKLSPDHFPFLQFLCGAGLSVAGALISLLMFNGSSSFHFLIFNLVFFFIVGYFLPLIKLVNDARNRQKNMIKDLSYYLDLMTLGVESGLDYLSVLTKAMVHSRPGPMKEELESLTSQIQMGKSRSEAWREFSERIDLPEIQSFILALIQTDQTGSPLSGTLRDLSVDIKTQRFQQAEKRAYQMPVKMLIPLLGCIFPAVFILIFEPLVLRYLQLL
ncbi:MAG: type II secretion system F family protein [Nitrospirae bacterium]|nr:type II secretion system F family protein [Nitrospirota bacterium]